MKRLIFCLCCLTLTACQQEIPTPEGESPKTSPFSPEIQLDTTKKSENSEEIEEYAVLDFLPEAGEGMAYLEKLGFEPFLFEWYLPVCVVGNGTVCYSGFTDEAPLWTGDVFLENDSTLEIFSDDLVYFYHESGEKYQLTAEGFLLLA